MDIGCGNGFIASILIREYINVYGMEASREVVEIANKENNGRFYVSDIASAQLPEAICKVPFKTVISTEVIEHIYSPKMYVKFFKSWSKATLTTLLQREGFSNFNFNGIGHIPYFWKIMLIKSEI